MGCNEVRNIIDQITNREIPENALCDAMDHINSCESCSEYLKSARAVGLLLKSCDTVEPLHNDPFERFNRQLEEKEIRVPLWKMVLAHPFTRPAIVVGLILVAVVAGGFSAYNANVNATPSLADQKIDATLIKMPDGAVLMKTSDGREIIFLDPVLEAEGKVDDVLRELREAMSSHPEDISEDLHFASN
jgi:hypothetical protein